MSDPARNLPPYESGGRPAPGPLRDWLAAMKAQAPAAQAPAQPQVEARQVEARHAEARPAPRPEARAAEQAWSPRIVQQPAEAPRSNSDAEDVSELMAENLMLKAKLRLEADRHGELQTLLAQEIRELRNHVQIEMNALQEIRAERDHFRGERDQIRDELDAMREERDLWRARTEALAQPLFQKR
ncbi:ATPase [Methylobacterium sp. J-059]|uniref:ATPase n=1 Tax=Methylobacterium sp. J-059 TaxID=2836643 RepID=UPI001FBA294D|nr:ATPase [Methylobacterium sp. J-059]MCJ2038502.1 ATPase [Methylobacterium sp. J-059]